MHTLFTAATGMLLGFQAIAHGGISTTSHTATPNPGPETAANITLISTMAVWVTAYTSTPEETDDTPFITASGKRVRDGIVATNMLPFGTRIKMPELFGDRVFIVEDRMHSRKEGFIDIWMSQKHEALRFGIRRTEIEVLGTREIELLAANKTADRGGK